MLLKKRLNVPKQPNSNLVLQKDKMLQLYANTQFDFKELC